MAQVCDLDLETGAQTYRDMTPEEEANLEAERAAAAAERTAAQDAGARRQAAIVVVQAKAAEDPAFAALAHLLGVQGS